MRKIDNKGMTTIELLITFVIVVIIVVSMYASVSNMKDKQTKESYKESLITYKDLLTRDIQSDLIMKQVIDANVVDDHTVDLTFKDGSNNRIVINKSSNNTLPKEVTPCSNPGSSTPDSITYGGVDFPLPDIGSDNIEIGGTCKKVYSLTIGDVNISTDNGVFHLYVELTHPDLGNKYSINIVCPIDYK